MYFPQKFCPQTAVTFRVVRTQPLESAQLTTLMSVVRVNAPKCPTKSFQENLYISCQNSNQIWAWEQKSPEAIYWLR